MATKALCQRVRSWPWCPTRCVRTSSTCPHYNYDSAQIQREIFKPTTAFSNGQPKRLRLLDLGSGSIGKMLRECCLSESRFNETHTQQEGPLRYWAGNWQPGASSVANQPSTRRRDTKIPTTQSTTIALVAGSGIGCEVIRITAIQLPLAGKPSSVP